MSESTLPHFAGLTADRQKAKSSSDVQHSFKVLRCQHFTVSSVWTTSAWVHSRWVWSSCVSSAQSVGQQVIKDARRSWTDEKERTSRELWANQRPCFHPLRFKVSTFGLVHLRRVTMEAVNNSWDFPIGPDMIDSLPFFFFKQMNPPIVRRCSLLHVSLHLWRHIR